MFDDRAAPERTRQVIREYDSKIIDAAVYKLAKDSPENSALGVLSDFQKRLALGMLFMLVLAAIFFPIVTFISLNAVMAVYFLCAVGYRLLLMTLGAKQLDQNANAHPQKLPCITILAPLYHDAQTLPALSSAIDSLDYPSEKKDVKLLLEADDQETLAEAKRLNLDSRYDILIIPETGPQTKPKACNFGLQLARGSLVVIYDAEDQPERDQLKKAASAFAKSDDKLACVQAKLNYYNKNENWLTRLFTLEYSLWFDWLLPALQRLGAPIPLGGTSNFFRADILKKVGGWDPYNVTEDADLGLRLSKLGYRIEMLDSTTYEEANCRLGNWVRQRSRWIKGHLQTWLVHMRSPEAFVKASGWHGLFSIQMFLAANVFSALINPLLWAAFLFLQFSGLSGLSEIAPRWLQHLNFAALVFGNLCFIAFAAAAPLKRGWFFLCVYGITAPLYWILTSIAAYKALWQIIVRPYYWEKTDHMISEMAVQRRAAALATSNLN